VDCSKPHRSEWDHAETNLRPASPNHHSTSALFWDIMQHRVLNSLPTFQESLLAPFSKVKKSTRRKEDK